MEIGFGLYFLGMVVVIGFIVTFLYAIDKVFMRWLILDIFGSCSDCWCLASWFGNYRIPLLTWIILMLPTHNISSSRSTRTLLKNLVTTITHTLTLTTQTSHQQPAVLTALVCVLKTTPLIYGPSRKIRFPTSPDPRTKNNWPVPVDFKSTLLYN